MPNFDTTVPHIARVTGVPYVADTGEPLIRFRRHYLPTRL
jgi:hypothetical protein